jgi:hypothetical protein
MPSRGGLFRLCPTMDDLRRHRNPQPNRETIVEAEHAKQRHRPFARTVKATVHEKDRCNNTKL